MATSPVLLEIFRNRFKAIVEEMATVTLRTSFTAFVKETSDFGACLVAKNGEVLAAPTETSVSLMIGLPAWEAIRAFEHYEEGDVGIANDPDTTRGLSTHLPDIWVWKPIFHEGEIVAFAFNFIHSSDVGGSVPGSISAANTDIFQEGIRIPPLKLLKAGVLNQDVVDLILLNCRIAHQNWGDIKAELASLTICERRVKELADRYGRNVMVEAIDDLLTHAEARARKILSQLPDGEYRASDYMEAKEGRPIRIALRMTIKGSAMHLDFTGTDLQVKAAFNLPTWGQQGHYMLSLALLNYFRTLDADIPYNSGLVRPLSMKLPKGSIVNPDAGLAYGVRAATFIRVMDCIMACLAQAMPSSTPSASSGAVAIVMLSRFDEKTGERHISVAQPLSGGSGGRPRLDGIDGASFTGGWLRNIPNEVLENEMPVMVEEYGYVVDSSAPGAHRGGSAIRFRMRSLAPELLMTVRGLERFRFRPWGMLGGEPGGLARTEFVPKGGEGASLGRFNNVTMHEGDVVEFQTPSGGGYGNPLERPVQSVLDDIRSGFVSRGLATSAYGVEFDADGQVDEHRTRARRAASDTASTESFAMGDERAEFERTWPEAVQEAWIALLLRCPRSLWQFLRKRLEPDIQAMSRDGNAPDAESLEKMVREFGVTPLSVQPEAAQ
ncbi:hydantoinase B/oxoprolinase family protein [Burkholderia cepacia]|uniref:hydantoinase B/oxoprolinase family protein n=1 Tax=Burkholderia cepacia TaxID=292 RepID=UPI002AB713F6|nr:hydantoinase B/oxoprolinase family protein [Burkholderia cepacia]